MILMAQMSPLHIKKIICFLSRINPTSKLQAIMVSTSTDFSAAQAASLMVRIEGQGVRTPIAQIVTSFGGTSTSVPSASSVADIIPLNLDVVHKRKNLKKIFGAFPQSKFLHVCQKIQERILKN